MLARLLVVLAALAVVAAACGSDGDEPTATDDDTEAEDDSSDDDDSGGGSELPNACPAEGCQVFLTDVEAADGGELMLTFDANFTPDFERNHIHVFWDSQEPGAVSSDYDTRGFDVQGKWHPTDDYPTYVTQSDASVDAASRGESTTVCVTAADTDHAVIDDGLFACRDVADLLS